MLLPSSKPDLKVKSMDICLNSKSKETFSGVVPTATQRLPITRVSFKLDFLREFQLVPRTRSRKSQLWYFYKQSLGVDMEVGNNRQCNEFHLTRTDFSREPEYIFTGGEISLLSTHQTRLVVCYSHSEPRF